MCSKSADTHVTNVENALRFRSRLLNLGGGLAGKSLQNLWGNHEHCTGIKGFFFGTCDLGTSSCTVSGIGASEPSLGVRETARKHAMLRRE